DPVGEAHIAPFASVTTPRDDPTRAAGRRGRALRLPPQVGDLGAARGKPARAVESLPTRGPLARLGKLEPESPILGVLADRDPEARPRSTDVTARELRLAEDLPRLERPRQPGLRPPCLRLGTCGVSPIRCAGGRL